MTNMIEDDIRRLIVRDSRDLAGLEGDIWKQEAFRRASQTVTRRLASWQAAVMAVAVVISATAGTAVAMHNTTVHQPSGLVLAETLAPSALLFGHRP
jgi:hypothetical protein